MVALFSLLPLKTDKERLFYGKLVAENNFGVRELRKQISPKVFERTQNTDIQISGSKTIEKGILKDPYLFDFLDLKEGYLENDLESAILK